MRYVVAAEGQRWIESQWIRTGQYTTRSDDLHRVPDGIWHAVAEDAGTTACRFDGSIFEGFDDQPFVRRFTRDRCPDGNTDIAAEAPQP